jgi:hypothetical protein
VQVKVGEGQHALHRIGRRRGAQAAVACRMVPARGIGQRQVVVVEAGVAAHARHRRGGNAVAAREQVHGRRAAFERHRGGVECRCGTADDGHRLARERPEVDCMAGVRGQALAHGGRQQLGNEGRAAAGHAVGKDQLARRFRARLAVHFEVQPEMRHRAACHRLEANQLGAVTHRGARDVAEPVEVSGPVGAADAVDGRIGLMPVARLVPGLEPQRRHRSLGPDQVLQRAQLVHARPREPHARLSGPAGRVDHAHAADPRALQREGEGAAALAAADDEHVVVHALVRGHPVGRRRAEQAQRFVG